MPAIINSTRGSLLLLHLNTSTLNLDDRVISYKSSHRLMLKRCRWPFFILFFNYFFKPCSHHLLNILTGKPFPQYLHVDPSCVGCWELLGKCEILINTIICFTLDSIYNLNCVSQGHSYLPMGCRGISAPGPGPWHLQSCSAHISWNLNDHFILYLWMMCLGIFTCAAAILFTGRIKNWTTAEIQDFYMS